MFKQKFATRVMTQGQKGEFPMRTQATKVKLLWIGLSLLLLVLPMQPVWGQQEPLGDDPVAAEATMEADPTPSEAEEEIVVLDEAALTQRVFLPVVQQSSEAGLVSEDQDEESAEVSAAFTQSWFALPCTNVQLDQFGLWDDVPGAGPVDAGLFWFVQDNPSDEHCTYYTQIPGGVLTASFPHLQFRAAIGDGASLTVRVFRFSGASCGTVLSTFMTAFGADNNQFSTRTLSLPPGYSVCRIELTLSDEPNDSGASRTSALLAYLRIQNTATPPLIAWQETFSNN